MVQRSKVQFLISVEHSLKIILIGNFSSERSCPNDGFGVDTCSRAWNPYVSVVSTLV